MEIYVPLPITKYIEFNPDICDGCRNFREPLCVRACREGMLIPNPKSGKPPIEIYSEECCECGCCVHACPHALKGAIKLKWPIGEIMRWKRKQTNDHFRVEMPNPSPPNPKPPVSGWYPETRKTT